MMEVIRPGSIAMLTSVSALSPPKDSVMPSTVSVSARAEPPETPLLERDWAVTGDAV